MSRYVTDTHAFVWHLQASPKLSLNARAIFRDADEGAHRILVPSIVLVELVYLAERKRIESTLIEQAFDLLMQKSVNYRVVPLNTIIAKTLGAVNATQIPEMPDRIIVATAKCMRSPLITHDRAIINSAIVPVVW